MIFRISPSSMGADKRVTFLEQWKLSSKCVETHNSWIARKMPGSLYSLASHILPVKDWAWLDGLEEADSPLPGGCSQCHCL